MIAFSLSGPGKTLGFKAPVSYDFFILNFTDDSVNTWRFFLGNISFRELHFPGNAFSLLPLPIKPNKQNS